MACAEFINVTQKITLNLPPNTIDGFISGILELSVENINSITLPISGVIICPYTRDLIPPINVNNPPITSQFSFSGVTDFNQTFTFSFYYPPSNPNNIQVPTTIILQVGTCSYTIDFLSFFNLSIQNTNTQNRVLKSGCTDINYLEYDPSANVDNGSCETLRSVFGCTNPLAINYNEDSLINDGSCVFLSGCTKPAAINYNPQAIIEDGSCDCGDMLIEMDLFSGNTICLSSGCSLNVGFDFRKEIDCLSFMEYAVRQDGTVLDNLNKLAIDLEVYYAVQSGNVVDIDCEDTHYYDYSELSGLTYELGQTETVWEYAFNPTGSTGLGFYGLSGDCYELERLIGLEMGFDCILIPENEFTMFWERYNLIVPSSFSNRILKLAIRLRGFRSKICMYFDNIIVDKLCDKIEGCCEIIPSDLGFDFVKEVDDKKSWVYANSNTQRMFNLQYNREAAYNVQVEPLVLNTKEISLTINPSNYIFEDVRDYLDANSPYLPLIENYNLSGDTFVIENINVTNRQLSRYYTRLQYFYDLYNLNNYCAVSNRLGYLYYFQMIQSLGFVWYDVLLDFIPATTIHDLSPYYLTNLPFHHNIFRYRNYQLINGNGAGGNCFENVNSYLECNIISQDCYATPTTGLFDGLDTICLTSGTSICYNYMSNEPTNAGVLIEYIPTTGSNIVTNIWGVDNYLCAPTEIYGCTNPSSPNYNPNATIDDGSCINCEVISGCTYSNATNYNPDAIFDDGSCIFMEQSLVTCDPDDLFTFEAVIEHDAIAQLYAISVKVLSPSNYTNAIKGNYRMSALDNTVIETQLPNLFNGSLTNYDVVTYVEVGFNELTPAVVLNSSSTWLTIVSEDAFVQPNASFVISSVIITNDNCVRRVSTSVILPNNTIITTGVLNYI